MQQIGKGNGPPESHFRAYEKMKKVTGARLEDAKFEDYQRLFKCEPNSLNQVPSTGCNTETMDFPVKCSFPPCNVCYKGPWMFTRCFQAGYTVDGYNLIPNPPHSHTEESASKCQKTCQLHRDCDYFTYYEGNNSCTTKTANAMNGLKHVEAESGIPWIFGPKQCPSGK